MKINEITEAFSAWDAIKSEFWKSMTPAGRAGLEKASMTLPTKYPQPAATIQKPTQPAASTTIPKLAPDQVAYLDINGSKVFLRKDGKAWMQYQGSNWPQDLNTSQMISDPRALAAIDAAMAAGKLQIASTKKAANFSKPGFSGYQSK